MTYFTHGLHVSDDPYHSSPQSCTVPLLTSWKVPAHRTSSVQSFTVAKKANKRQIMVALFSREDHIFNNGQRQTELERNDFLWSIVVRKRTSKSHDNYCFDVRQTNLESSRSDQSRSVGDWQFRAITKCDPSEEDRLLGHVMIGKIPHSVSHDQILDILEALPLPQSNKNPEENEVTWIRNAIHRLQLEDYAERFDIDKFMRYAQECATSSTNPRDNVPFKVNYTFRPM